MIDAQARLDALNARISFIMEAPAGSGKTEVLVRRILSLLLNVEHPSAILAITFTRKACAEMKERVHQALFADNLNADAEKLKLVHDVRARIQALHWSQDDLNSLSILTIDALCARILTEQGRVVDRSLKVLPHYEVLGDELMFALLEHLEAPDEYSQALSTVFLYFGNQIEKIKHLLLDILSQRVEWLSIFVPRQGQVQNLKDEMAGTLISLYRDLWQRWNALKPQIWVRQVNAWLNLSEANIADIKKIARLLLSKQGDLRKRFDASLGLGSEFKFAYQELVKDIAESDACESWLLFLRELAALPPIDTETLPLLEALVKILPLTAAHWQVLLSEYHYRDFQEDALQAVLCLSSSDPVANALLRFERELKHILVDEFQDTSRLQFRMLELITQTWTPLDGRTLFLVGDPMQSIYRFRDARVELFLEARERGIGQVRLTPLRLRSNFRTDASVLDFVNQHLQVAFPKQDDLLTGAVSFCKSVSERHYEDAVGVETLVFESAEQEAEVLLLKIKTLLVRDETAQIAILARSRPHLNLLMQVLIAHDIPILAEDWGHFSEAQIIRDLVSLTFALTHLGDRLAWLSVLRSPMVNFNLDELLLVSTRASSSTIWQVLHEPSFVQDLSLESQGQLEHLLKIIDPLIFDPSLLLLVKVQKVFIALTQAFKFSFAEENMLLQYWDFLAEMPVLKSYHEFNEGLQTLKLNYQDAGARVQLLTIHQAKGLEFDYVFLPHLNQGVRRSDPPLLRYRSFHLEGQFKLLLGLHKSAEGEEDLVYQYLHWLSKEEDANEQVRLLYVALTRAKKGLFLSYFKDAEANEFKARAGSFLKLLEVKDGK